MDQTSASKLAPPRTAVKQIAIDIQEVSAPGEDTERTKIAVEICTIILTENVFFFQNRTIIMTQSTDNLQNFL